jgi:hypothetical protein
LRCFEIVHIASANSARDAILDGDSSVVFETEADQGQMLTSKGKLIQQLNANEGLGTDDDRESLRSFFPSDDMVHCMYLS